MTRLSGWCSGPNGCNSLADHTTCADRMARGLLTFGCGCEDWGRHPKQAETPAVERDSVRATWEDGGTNQDGPRPAALTAGSSRGLADTALGSVD